MVGRAFALWMAAAILFSSPAFAQKPDDARVFEARKDCLSGRVEAGVALLADLYAETRDANLIFNQGRCYEQNGRPTNAINSFREYLRVSPNITSDERAQVERHLAECQALQAEQERKSASGVPVQAPSPPSPAPVRPDLPVPTSAPPVPTSDSPVPASAPPAGLDISASPSPKASHPVYKTWWFWTGTAAVVVAGVVTGILLANRSSGACDGIDFSCRGVK
jgi:hypothetical protein